jgi:hypothetical protein
MRLKIHLPDGGVSIATLSPTDGAAGPGVAWAFRIRARPSGEVMARRPDRRSSPGV